MHEEELREDPTHAAEIIRQLVDLGYLEPPGDDVEESVRRVARDRKVNLAVALTDSRRAGEAVSLWEQLADEFPDEPGFLVQLASCFLRLGHWSECQRALDRISGELKDTPYVRLMQAKLALEEEGPESAVRLARAITPTACRSTGILNRLGELFLRAEAWQDAEAIFTMSLSAVEDNAVAHHGLAQVLLRKGEHEAAVEQALLAVGLIHYFPAAHYHLGLALHGCRRHAESIAAFETSLAMGYEPGRTHRRLAELYLQVCRPDEAGRHASLAAQSDSTGAN